MLYRKPEEKVFQPLPFDLSKREFYPVYYRLMLRGDIGITEMFLSQEDKYTQEVVLAYAKGDFSEAEEHGIYLEEDVKKGKRSYSSELVEEYHLSE